jgi:hypothetical protein
VEGRAPEIPIEHVGRNLVASAARVTSTPQFANRKPADRVGLGTRCVQPLRSRSRPSLSPPPTRASSGWAADAGTPQVLRSVPLPLLPSPASLPSLSWLHPFSCAWLCSRLGTAASLAIRRVRFDGPRMDLFQHG